MVLRCKDEVGSVPIRVAGQQFSCVGDGSWLGICAHWKSVGLAGGAAARVGRASPRRISAMERVRFNLIGEGAVGALASGTSTPFISCNCLPGTAGVLSPGTRLPTRVNVRREFPRAPPVGATPAAGRATSAHSLLARAARERARRNGTAKCVRRNRQRRRLLSLQRSPRSARLRAHLEVPAPVHAPLRLAKRATNGPP
jgi:hypothetical protein